MQQNPFRLAQTLIDLLLPRFVCSGMRGCEVRYAAFLAIASDILFDFFNGRVFSTEYDLTPTSEARLNWKTFGSGYFLMAGSTFCAPLKTFYGAVRAGDTCTSMLHSHIAAIC